MAKPKWYSPQLTREVVSRLYHKAKAERISMTAKNVQRALVKRTKVRPSKMLQKIAAIGAMRRGMLSQRTSTKAISKNGEKLKLVYSAKSSDVFFIAAAATRSTIPMTSTAQPHCN